MSKAKRGKLAKHRESFHSLSHPTHPPLPVRPTNTIPSHHRTHHLLYLITFLLIILVLVVFFSFSISYTSTPTSSEETDYSLAIDSVSCQWGQGQFTICETVSWSGSNTLFAKGYIPGGESLDMSNPQYNSPFTYCQPVGTEEGFRIARSLLYSSRGLVRDIGQGVQCLDKPLAPVLPPTPSGNVLTVTTGFRAYPDTSSTPRGSGMFTKTFPGKVDSCTFSGFWITDNNIRFNQRNQCHKATGTFSGYADLYEQYVINDPDLFRWAGISRAALNPPVATYEGYSFWMETCDNDYYSLRHIPRYTTKGTISGFGTDTLAFIWDYYDQNNRPVIDFSFILDCQIR
ncbi:MAG TPA: hypothetical protein VJH37_03820 [Candidatus Nanoarchaeia archaeon]|nr:hypothetical protein [Candidatus Nanoarchaeia archaeon]